LKVTGGRIGLAVVCCLFGILVMVQLRTESRLQQTTDAESATDLAAIAGDLYDNNSALRQEVDKLETERNTAQKSVDVGAGTDVAAELQRLSAFNGTVEVNGPGVELTVDADIRPVDLLDLLNELRNAGAEAISVGGERIVYNTAITGTGGQIFVNTTPLASPFVVDTLGPPDVLDRALARKGGMLSYLKTAYPRGQISLTTRDSMTLPGFRGQFLVRGS
jgi:uncharacterized protein YlxW (UPF0749 family)